MSHCRVPESIYGMRMVRGIRFAYKEIELVYSVVVQTQYEFLQSRASCLFAGSWGISWARIVGPDIGLEAKKMRFKIM